LSFGLLLCEDGGQLTLDIYRGNGGLFVITHHYF